MRANSNDNVTASNEIKKSFFKGFLGRGSSKDSVKQSANLQPQRAGSLAGIGHNISSNIQKVAMNMMFKNSKPESREKETPIPVNGSFAVNRTFG